MQEVEHQEVGALGDAGAVAEEADLDVDEGDARRASAMDGTSQSCRILPALFHPSKMMGVLAFPSSSLFLVNITVDRLTGYTHMAHLDDCTWTHILPHQRTLKS